MLVQNNSAVHQCVEIKIPDMRTCSGDPMAGYLFIEADGFDLSRSGVLGGQVSGV